VRILVTGANGFVGRALCRYFMQDGRHEIVAAVRKEVSPGIYPAHRPVGNIDQHTSWAHAMEGIDVVVHLAARAHLRHHQRTDSLAAYRSVNTEGTINLALQAARAGVRRLVFVSSVKVCGEGQSQPGQEAYCEDQLAAPNDAYAISKWEAEQGLWDIAAATGVEVVILRPPLVYGPGVGANFLSLMRAVDSGLPLPFAKVDNCRDLIYVGNLVHAVLTCVEHPAARNRTFLLSDGESVSTPELIRRLGAALNRPARLLRLPEKWLRFAGLLTGKQAALDRLLGSLMVNSGAIRHNLDWSPPYSMGQGLMETAKWYRTPSGTGGFDIALPKYEKR
jgi:nucleoside-diphosphate-sugar epimerase